MQRTIRIAAGLLVVAIVIIVMTARGPVGPETVLCKDVAGFVAGTALQADASVESQLDTNPSGIVLPAKLELKRRLKRTLGSVGVMVPVPESAMAFAVRSKQRSDSVRCLILCRGDHVIGVAVVYSGAETELTRRLRSTLGSMFRGSEVQ